MNAKKHGFSLLELITVLVIIAIISSLIGAGISAHRRAVLVASTKVQFLQYEAAINGYCREYGDLPTFFCDEELVALSDGNNAQIFVKILSGRDPSGAPLSPEDKKMLNPKGKEFHVFSDDEFFLMEDGTHDYKYIADAFNNKNIFVIVEDPFDEDTIISKRKFPESVRKLIKGDGVRNSVVIFSISDDGHTIISNCLDQYF
jgi:prepilin-type N-terminal cleavage/methylation domain-containing protein